LKDYTNVTKDQAIGLTTYSNSEANCFILCIHFRNPLDTNGIK
jgi:hypothetical protein